MKFIIDKEINLKETDSLNSKSYSETLTETIKTTPTDKSFTIGLFGEWGSGKSSIVETSKLELESLKDEKIKFIVYDAWKYANDSFRRMFLLKVQESLKFDRTSLMNSFYLNESEDVEIKKKLNNTNLIVIILIMVFGIILVNTLPIDSDKWKLSLSIFISFLGLFSTILFKAFDEFKINIQKPHLFAPEQFEDCFIEMISKSLKGYSNIEKALLWIQGETYEKDIDKLVIVIDNIDRCNKELAYELLTDTKSFLGQVKNVVFLIPVDDQALKKHILSSNANNTEAEEFLRKFFSVTIRIKPLRTVELFDFANKINTDNNLGFNPDTIDIVSKEYATNPRRIIQFFNNLAVEIHNFEINFNTDFIVNNESLICKLLIIREEWPQYYKLLSSYPHLLNGSNNIKSELLKESPDLELFLKNTKAISKNIDVTVFDKLLSNGNVFDKLTTDVKKSIDNQDFEQVHKLISDKSVQKNDIINYTIDQLSKGISRQSYSTLVPRMFNQLIEINNQFELSISINRRIQNIVEDVLDKFIKNTENLSSLIKYIDSLHSQRINYLSDYTISFITTEYQKENEDDEIDEFCILLLESFVTKTKSLKLLNGIKKPFAVFFKSQEDSLKELIEPEKVEFILTDHLIEHIISNIDQLESVTPSLEDLNFISDNLTLSTIINEKIFEKFNTIYPNFTNRNKEYLLNVFKNLTQLINNLKYKKTFTQTESFITKILSNRTIQNRPINIITEIINSPEEIKTLILFLRNIYKATSCSINVSSYYNTIAISNSENRSLVNKSFLSLKNEYYYPLTPLYDTILNDTTYAEETLELLEHLFSAKDKKGHYRLEEDKLSNKIVQMADIIFNEEDKAESIIRFFEKIISIPPVKEVLSDIISGKSKEEILRLSPSLLKLSFDKITQSDNLFSYQEDIEVLKAIGESGEKSHLTKLSKVVVSKLLQEETYDEAFEIIESTNKFNDRDTKSLIGQLENIAEIETYKERAEKLIDSLKNK